MPLTNHRLPPPKAVSIADAAAMLGVCRATVYSLLRAKTLKSVRIGKRHPILTESLDKVLEIGGATKPPQRRAVTPSSIPVTKRETALNEIRD